MPRILTHRRIGLLTLAICLLLAPSRALGQIQVGYTVLTPDGGGQAPTGTALFTFTNGSGILVSQAGVGAVEPLSSGRIFVDERGTQTALAIANPNLEAASVVMVVRDTAGTQVATQTETLGANAHLARFVSELFTGQTPGFTGSLTFTSSQPIGAIAFRQTLTNPTNPSIRRCPLST